MNGEVSSNCSLSDLRAHHAIAAPSLADGAIICHSVRVFHTAYWFWCFRSGTRLPFHRVAHRVFSWFLEPSGLRQNVIQLRFVLDDVPDLKT